MSKTIEAEEFVYTVDSWRDKPTVHKILVIEYHGGIPHAVCTDRSSFDFEWCKRDGTLYFRDVGSGLGNNPDHQVHGFCNPSPPPAKIWIAEGVRLHRYESEKRPKVPVDDETLLKMGYVRIKRPLVLKTGSDKTRNPFEAGEESDGHFVYCSVCKSYMPDDDSICGHIVVTQADEPIGVGGEEPKREDFFAALDWIRDELDRDQWAHGKFFGETDAVRALEIVLRKNDPPRCHVRHCVISDAEYSEQWDDIQDGLAWLGTLNKKTVKENKKTLKWIREWREAEPVRSEAKRRAGIIAELESLAKTPEKAQEITAALGMIGKKRADLDNVPTAKIEEVLREQQQVSGVNA